MARSGIMLCYPFEEKRLNKWTPPYIVQPKLDGERCRAKWFPEHGWALFSSEENVIISVPHINKALKDIPINCELDGELYTHGLSFEEIHSRVGRSINLHPESEQINFHVFDIVGRDSQISRINTLDNLLYSIPSSKPIKLVPSVIAESFDDIMRTYDGFLRSGYEGMIVRHPLAPYVRKRSTYMMKFKPKKSDFYKIIGIKEEVDKFGIPKNSLGALVCTSDEGTKFSVGSGLTQEQRQSLWSDDVVGKICHVSYQHITPGKGVPRFPVFVSITDYNPEDS